MGTISYQNTSRTSYLKIIRGTSGGTVETEVSGATFDYFDDSPTADDYIAFGVQNRYDWSRLTIYIGTALAGVNVEGVWEARVYDDDTASSIWTSLKSYSDATQDFTQTGSLSINFGIPWKWRRTTLGGQSALYIRYRLVSFDSVSEGGANSTSAPTALSADVRLTDYTDGSPCTLEEIDDWLTTNASWLAPRRVNNYYDFREVCLDCNSRLLVQNETLEIGFAGNNNRNNGYYDLRYLQMGEKVGDNMGRNGGTLIVNMSTNSFRGALSTTTKFYGAKIYGTYWGYPNWSAETLYCLFDNVNPVPTSSGKVNNCLIKAGGTWIIWGTWFGEFDNNKVVIPIDSGFKAFGLFYNSGFTCEGLDYEFTGTGDGRFIYFYNSSANSGTIWRFRNPLKTLPAVNGDPPMFRRTQSNLTLNPSKVWFYDDSAGTYTDITTEATNNTTGDVPFYGDVGDCILFGYTSTTGRYGTVLRVISTLGGTNDYEYTIEDLVSSTWREQEKIWDGTNNFTETGNFWYSRSSYSSISNTAVNGFTAHWVRIRITKKGTGTPSVDRVYLGGGQAMGDWRLWEEYSFSCRVLDEDGNELEGARVQMDYSGVSKVDEETDDEGLIDSQYLAYKEYYFDPLSDNTNSGTERTTCLTYGDYDLTVSMDGYETYQSKIVMDKQRHEVITLKTAIDTMPVLGRGVALRVDPTNSTADRDALIMP